MEEIEKVLSFPEPLSNICRICFKYNEEMIDIFESGASSQIAEITDLQMESDDGLPQSICQTCTLEIDHFWKFLHKMRKSDTYLKSILTYNKELEGMKSEKHEFFQELENQGKVLDVSHDMDDEKMYLIIVPENENEISEQGETYVPDVKPENDNMEIFEEHKNLVNHYLNYTCLIEPVCGIPQVGNSTQLSYTLGIENKIFIVNLCVFKCNICNEIFEEKQGFLLSHFLMHDGVPSVVKNSYQCPVCNFTDDDKTIFFSHLQNHRKNENIIFVNVDPDGSVTVVRDENNLFFDSKKYGSGVFKLNLENVTCIFCLGHINSNDSISEHLTHCLSTENVHFFVKYICPVCQKLFTKKEEYMSHLESYSNENVYFVKVDSSGEVIDPDEDEMYVSYKDAITISCKKIYKIVEIFSCDLCDFEGDTFESFSGHYESVHFMDVNRIVEIICPVCSAEIECYEVNNKRLKFYDHLKLHQNEGVEFVRVKKIGFIADELEVFSDVFTQSKPLLCFLENKTSFTEVWSPEIAVCSQKNSNLEGYCCDICCERFKRKRELVKHIKTHEPKIKSLDYVCEKCGKKCAGKESFDKHTDSHFFNPKIKKPVCVFCKKKFRNRASLKSHVCQQPRESKEISKSEIACEKCGETFPNKASFTKHKKLHAKDKENVVLKCEICERNFFSHSTFNRHKSAHLNPQYLECDICKFPLPSIVSLQKHSEIHQTGNNTFDCQICKMSFLKKEALTCHQSQTGHYVDRQPFECNVCHEKFYVGKKFTNHIKKHPKYKMEKCTLCGKSLSTTQSLVGHMSRHFEYNSILCPHCGKQFFEEKNYNRHLLTHEGIKPYPCDFENCKKSFYTFFELNRHKKYHSNTRNFLCPYCSKGFHESNHLTVHVRTHTGERPYTCPHCEKGFPTRSRCKLHIKKVHQGVGYELIQSNISKKVTVFETVEAV